jgi:site-specific DNA-methyltransferase (adenine-specific)
MLRLIEIGCNLTSAGASIAAMKIAHRPPDELPQAVIGRLLAVASARGPGWVLVHGEAIDTMMRLPSGSVDLVFADPPYFLSDGGKTCRGGKRVVVDKGAWDAPTSPALQHDFHRRWLAECRRLLSPSGTLWVSGTHHVIYSVGWALQRDGWEVLNAVTWQKPAPPPNLGRRSLTHSTEQVIWARPFVDAPHVFNYHLLRKLNGGKQMKDVWRIGRPRKSEMKHGRHPTQKPRELLQRIILAASAPGAIVLEPFAGSGIAGQVALEFGRRYVGIDLDDASVKLARLNLGDA